MKLIEAQVNLIPGVFVWRNNTGGAQDRFGNWVSYGRKGQADLTGLMTGGRRLEIEVKDVSGRQSKDQKEFGELITALGGLYIIAKPASDDPDDVRRMVAAVVDAVQGQR